jgi:hypothetical protein
VTHLGPGTTLPYGQWQTRPDSLQRRLVLLDEGAFNRARSSSAYQPSPGGTHAQRHSVQHLFLNQAVLPASDDPSPGLTRTAPSGAVRVCRSPGWAGLVP